MSNTENRFGNLECYGDDEITARDARENDVADLDELRKLPDASDDAEDSSPNLRFAGLEVDGGFSDAEFRAIAEAQESTNGASQPVPAQVVEQTRDAVVRRNDEGAVTLGVGELDSASIDRAISEAANPRPPQTFERRDGKHNFADTQSRLAGLLRSDETNQFLSKIRQSYLKRFAEVEIAKSQNPHELIHNQFQNPLKRAIELAGLADNDYRNGQIYLDQGLQTLTNIIGNARYKRRESHVEEYLRRFFEGEVEDRHLGNITEVFDYFCKANLLSKGVLRNFDDCRHAFPSYAIWSLFRKGVLEEFGFTSEEFEKYIHFNNHGGYLNFASLDHGRVNIPGFTIPSEMQELIAREMKEIAAELLPAINAKIAESGESSYGSSPLETFSFQLGIRRGANGYETTLNNANTINEYAGQVFTHENEQRLERENAKRVRLAEEDFDQRMNDRFGLSKIVLNNDDAFVPGILDGKFDKHFAFLSQLTYLDSKIKQLLGLSSFYREQVVECDLENSQTYQDLKNLTDAYYARLAEHKRLQAAGFFTRTFTRYQRNFEKAVDELREAEQAVRHQVKEVARLLEGIGEFIIFKEDRSFNDPAAIDFLATESGVNKKLETRRNDIEYREGKARYCLRGRKVIIDAAKNYLDEAEEEGLVPAQKIEEVRMILEELEAVEFDVEDSED
ncbi:hypothetical protein ACFL21_00140 [Patescibacteria group bacterium]